MKILVTGGAGYIGSFMTKRLLDLDNKVVVFDSLERGYKKAIDDRAKFVSGDIKDEATLENLFQDEIIDAVMHFAGYISVEESTKDPQKYYENNVTGTKNLVETMIGKGNIDKLIFSSSAAVYGNPIKIPIPEDHPKNPTSPYGENKLEVEKMLSYFQNNVGLSFVSLRYFNAGGASFDGKLGELHNPETHIIPLAIDAAINDTEFNLYGSNYNTYDGSCIRDYIHVIDLIEGHILALDKINRDKGGFYYNIGTGIGYSNKEVIEMVEKVSGKTLKVKVKSRRSGDAEALIADAKKIQKEIGFEPRYSDLETIVATAFEWHTKNSKFKIQNSK